MNNDNKKEQLKSLTRQRGAMKAKLTSFHLFVGILEGKHDRVEEHEVINLEQRLHRIKDLLSDYDTCQAELEQLVEDDTLDECYEQRSEFENKFYETIARAQGLVNELKPEEPVLNQDNAAPYDIASQNTVALHRKVKLPQLKLPQFDGSYDKWPAFHDMFTAIIHSDVRIDSIAKFHYLQSSLTGEALKVLDGLEISAINYEAAWELLNKRYQNNNLMIHKHIAGLFEQPRLTKENHESLRKMVDTARGHMRALTALKQPVNQWDSVLIYLISDKLDTSSKREWEKELAGKEEPPNIESFLDFLERRCQLLEKISKHLKTPVDSQTTKTVSKTRSNTTTLTHASISKAKCPSCEEEHGLFACKLFIDLPVSARIEHVKEKKACLNCLKLGHIAMNCKSQKCRKCGKPHNTLLHLERDKIQEKLNNNEKPTLEPQTVSKEARENVSAHTIIDKTTRVLPTAIVKIIGENGQAHKCNTLLDSGSQSNFMTTALCNALGLRTVKADVTVTGINQVTTKILETVKATIRSTRSEYTAELVFMVVPKITSHLPSEPLDLNRTSFPKYLPLADPHFDKPKRIHLLIGVDLFWELICYEPTGHPYLCRTKLGYIVSGRLPSETVNGSLLACNLSTSTDDISRQLERFWAIEEVSSNRILSPEEQACETLFQKTTRRNGNGRFIVSIPFKSSTDKLGDSRELALQRLRLLENRLQRNETMRQQYIDFMRNYKELGHMKKVVDDNPSTPSYYLPHHGVMKESSLTTKMRVVFNASAPTTTGLSLNDLQMVGPTIQQDLISILLCFRQHPYVVGADVAMMYRQILIDPSQCAFQRILWREKQSDTVGTYELRTVTYGMASSAFLAIRCLFSLAEEYQQSFPKAANVIRKCMYVDDLLFGAPSREEAIQLIVDITRILTSGCFELRKWISNDPSILETIDKSEDSHQFIKLNEGEATKTLGLSWFSVKDELIYRITLDSDIEPTTKRCVLSLISRLFDPLGLLSPIIISTKIMLQKLWKLQLEWDEPLPSELQYEWTAFTKQLASINELHIPRQVCCSSPRRIEIHGFADASEQAYGGCVYIRSINEASMISVRLLCAKTRVAPLKPLTIPKLELSAAHLLVNLITKMKSSLDITVNATYYWSDSVVCLSWIRIEPHRLQVFVRNRVSDIQTQSNPTSWRYVPSSENPADLLSRGTSPRLLSGLKLWWHGPAWLREPERHWPIQLDHIPMDLPEVKDTNSNALHITTHKRIIPFEKYSKLERLVRITAFCIRFISIRVRKLSIKGALSAQEMRQATIVLVSLAQRESFPEEYRALSTNKNISAQSKMLSLKPFLHNDNTIRVGGRLGQSDFVFDKRHPMILSSNHHLTKLIFRSEHSRLLHAGPQLLLAHIRDTYWPIVGRNLARQIVHQCIRCFRSKPKIIMPQMADLPSERVTPAPVFHSTGVDYAGPFATKDRKGRGCKTYKSYICLFICMTTKAIHLELVSDLTTENFIMALRRFVCRRGRPAKITSDNGTNFVGANSELHRLGGFLKENEEELQGRLVTEGINWSFIPSYSPHFGGLWEAGVRSTKHHLKRVMGNALLTFEEFYSLLVQIESILNFRPLSPISSHPMDLQPLTPAHFLTGGASTTIPCPDVIDVHETRLSRYQRVQQMQQHFWKRWSKEVISELQHRTKWKTNMGVLKINDLVLVKDDNLPPQRWRLGRVAELHPGTDGIARVATLRTTKGLIRRAAIKLCPLPVETL